MRLIGLLVLLLGTVGFACASSQQRVHIRLGIDDWLSAAPFAFGKAAATNASGLSATKIAAVEAGAIVKLKDAFGIDGSTFIPFGNGISGSSDGRYTIVPIGVGKPYRVLAAVGAWGWFKNLFTSSKEPTATLYELTISNTPAVIPIGTNYTGIYKGTVKGGDILAAGLYTITVESIIPFVKPTIIEMYMVSAVPGYTVGSITTENFRIWSPQYGSGIAHIQVIVGDVINAKGQFHVFIQNNFYFPAPDGVSTVPPAQN